MKNGQKTVGQIYREAVAQLKENYFQHVGLGGIYYAGSMLFSSIYTLLFIAVYFVMILTMPALFAAMMAPMASVGHWGYDGVAAAAGVLTAVLGISLVLAVVSLLFLAAVMVALIATHTVQAGIQKSVLLLLKGDKLAWQAVWGNFKQNWKRYLGISAWTGLWISLWGLLFFVPGIVKWFGYQLAPYLVIEYPGMTVRQALKKSVEISAGHRGKLFLIALVTMGLMVAASFLTNFGLMYAVLAASILFIYPLNFVMTTIAYRDIKQAAIDKGLLPAEGRQAGDEPAAEEYPMAIEGDQPEASETPGQQFTELEDDSPQL